MARPAATTHCIAALTLLCAAATSAFPQSTLTLTGAGPNSLAGIYIGPYTVTIDGVPTQAICDDYETETYFNTPWTANVSTLADGLTGKKFANQADALTKYKEVAWLSLQLFNPVSTCAPGFACGAGSNNTADIQFAIWQVFDSPTPISTLTDPDQSNAYAWLKAAEDQKLNNFSSLGDLSSYSFYTPNPLNASQEFIVKTPEASALALLGIDLSAVGGLLLVFHRRSSIRRSMQA